MMSETVSMPPPHSTLKSNSNDYVLHVLIEIPLVTYQCLWWNVKLQNCVNFYMNGLRVITPNYAGYWPWPTDTP